MKNFKYLLTVFALAVLMGLAFLPLMAKEVRAETYPSPDQITLEGFTLDLYMKVEYNAATGVLRLPADFNVDEDFTAANGLKVTGAPKYSQLTIEIQTDCSLSGGDIGIDAENCQLFIRGSGTLTVYASAKYDASTVYGIKCAGITVEDGVNLNVKTISNDANIKPRCIGIRSTYEAIVYDGASINCTCVCANNHTGDKADIGIWADDMINISSRSKCKFTFSEDGSLKEDRYALVSGKDNIVIQNSPEIRAENGKLTKKGDWSPEHYRFDYYVDPNTGGGWQTFTPQDRIYISLAGDNRWATAVEIAKTVCPNGPKEGEVVIVYGLNYPDALSANPYAGLVKAPILLSDRKKLAAPAAELLKQWKSASSKVTKVTVIGGGFEPQFFSDLEALGFSEAKGSLTNIAGSDRYETAELVTKALYAKAKAKSITIGSIALTTGANFADALSFSPWAYRLYYPILLVKKDGTVTEGTKALIDEANMVYLLGGENVCPESNLKTEQSSLRLAGEDRFETSQIIADYFSGMMGNYNLDGATFADGTQAHFPDALVGGSLVTVYGGPIVLTSESKTGVERVKMYVENRIAGFYSRGNTFVFLGWSAKGKSTEYSNLVKWIESRD